MADARALTSSVATGVSATGVDFGEVFPPGSKEGLGFSVNHASPLRKAAATSIAVFAVRRAPEVALLLTSYVTVEIDSCMVRAKTVRQRGDHFGVGRHANLVAVHLSERPASSAFFNHWPRFGSWLKAKKGRDGPATSPRVPESGGASPDALFFGLARAQFWCSMAPSGANAALGESRDGEMVFPRRRGTRLYIINGMCRVTAQELVGWKSTGVMGTV